MPEPPISAAEAAARLAAALDRPDELSCEEAEALLPALVDAERAGADVERDPAFAALLRHLEACEGCLQLYEQLAADLEAVAGEAPSLPPAAPSPPRFFAEPVRLSDHVLLEVVGGLARRFTLTLDLPRLAPGLATLGGAQRTLFSDRLSDVAGAPLLALTAGRDGEDAWLQVALREPGQTPAWRLQIELGDQTLVATADERGIARFPLPPGDTLGAARLSCEELPVEPEHD